MVSQWAGHDCKLRLIVNPRTHRSELTLYAKDGAIALVRQYEPWERDRADREATMLAECSLLERVA